MTTRDYTVVRVGTDSSGRGIYMTRWMQRVWEAILDDPRLAEIAHLITIVQGPWMTKNGGGAQDSAGYHDRGGCIDIRTWNLTATQLDLFIFVASEYGFHFWRRDRRHGMDPHAHGVLASDASLTDGARQQILDLKAIPRRDGLAGGGRDYERRYEPIRFDTPTRLLQEDPLSDKTVKAQIAETNAAVQRLEGLVETLATDEHKRNLANIERVRKLKEQNRRLIAELGGLADSLEGEPRRKVLAILARDTDIDGAEKPQEV